MVRTVDEYDVHLFVGEHPRCGKAAKAAADDHDARTGAHAGIKLSREPSIQWGASVGRTSVHTDAGRWRDTPLHRTRVGPTGRPTPRDQDARQYRVSRAWSSRCARLTWLPPLARL